MIEYLLVDVKRIKIILLIIFLAILGIELYNILPVALQKETPNLDKFSFTPALPKNCDTKDSIQYLYYVKTPEDKQKNNKVGLYIYAEESNLFGLAKSLVNSNGGDWGHVLIPYNVKDRDSTKWSRVFDQLLSKHLIPIIQLWDVNPKKYQEQTKDAAEFLDSFIWPIRERYISVYNEPNDAKFWQGKVDPKEYARVLRYSIVTFKEQNLDFFVLNGAFNASTSDSAESMDEEEYMKLMDEEVPGIFEQLDGWAHSYPQPIFRSPDDTGRSSIRAYQSELEFLKDSMGVKKELPVFITETGWAHAEGENYNASYLPVSKVSDYIKRAYEHVWLTDDRVVAVTPFTVWYDPPFDHFSWVNRDRVPYEHYLAVKSIKKVKGNPENLEVGPAVSLGCP
jgi:hypothetical protein